jgi:two-component system, response regulator
MEQEKKIEILLVEDNIDDSELTEFALTQAKGNIKYIHVTNGRDALNFIFGKKKYEGQEVQKELKLVLLDIGLPTLDGFEVLRKIREDQVTKMLPVVMLTSSLDQRDMSLAYELGANSYVVKPNGFDGYVKKIGSLGFYWSCVNERPSDLNV